MNKSLDKSEVLFLSISVKAGYVINVNRSMTGMCSILSLNTVNRPWKNDKVNYERNGKVKTSDVVSVDWYVKVLDKNKVLDRGTYIPK